LLAAWAPVFDSPSITGHRWPAKLALKLQDYGMQREKRDRDTFPTHMPKVGEPYDLVTGNAIRVWP
jgi:hypothetical protein